MRVHAIRIARWLPAILWAGIIFRVSGTSGSDLPGGPAWLAHLVEYAILGAAISWAAKGTQRVSTQIILATVLCSLYGISDEFHQSFVPSRTPDVMDWVMDTLGGATGATLTSLALLRFDRRAGTQGLED